MSAPRRPAEVFEVESPYPGRLAVCMRPRGGTWLADDIRSLHRTGWNVLVSAVMPGEVTELHLGAIGEVCEASGVEHFPFPIGNLQVPSAEQSSVLFENLLQRLRSGMNIAAHCHGSVGRSPLIVASLLVLAGVPPDDAWSRIRIARQEQVPDTYEQRDWVWRFVPDNPANLTRSAQAAGRGRILHAP